ncbi:MAG: nickel-dependent lactate racemase [Christensenellaceae bacterium]|jgi:nickel-dependent lactate racemase|nr:nickel-dependent lactate racemase [Christensenellaceae bacterium]
MSAIHVGFKFGTGIVSADFQSDNLMGVLKGDFIEAPLPEEELTEVLRSIREPIGGLPLEKIVEPNQRIVIMVSDITRPVPSWKILPVLLDELNTYGVADSHITVLFGMGIHRAHSEEERKKLVGEEVYRRVYCCDSVNGEPYVHVGNSKLGTPYYVHQRVVAADVLICTGNIEYHWFAGYSGGAKAVLPGACSFETIRASHSRIGQENTEAGNLNSPVRQDIDGILDYMGIDFIVNVVIDDNKRILRSFAGDPIEAHRAGCAYLDSIYGREIPHAADVVVASCGGYPKDINIYQAQKALDNANLAVRTGGTIILIGSCQEGFGDKTFESWMRDANSPQEILNRIHIEFQMGGHKAASFAKVLVRARIVMVTDMAQADVSSAFLEYASIDQLQNKIDQYAQGASSVLVIPQAGSILPIVGQKE